MSHWEVFGASLAIISSVISNLGVNIQKYSHKNDSKLPEFEQRAYVQRPIWWLGFVLVMLGSVGDFAAFGFATQSLVAALGGGTTLVSNVLTAHYLNKEALYKTDIIGVTFVIIGVIIIAAIAEPNVEYPLPELEKRFVRTEFVVYIVTVGVCTVSMLATIKGSMANRLKNQVYWSRRRQKQLMKQFELRIQRVERRVIQLEERLLHPEALTDEEKQAIDDSRAQEEDARIQKKLERVGDIIDGVAQSHRVPYYYAICSGIIGAVTVLLAKCSAVMIALSLKGDNQFKYGLTYIFLGGMFVCVLLQTHLLNMATSLGDIMTVFPIFQAFWIVFSVIGGTVFYESEKHFTLTKWVLYPLSMVCIVVGVGFLVQHASLGAESAAGKWKRSEMALDEQLEVCLVTDSSMDSPLLGAKERKKQATGGYLQLEA